MSVVIVNRQVVVPLKAKIKKMNKRMRPLLHPQKWEVGEQVIYRSLEEKDHSLSPLCVDLSDCKQSQPH